MLIIKVVYEAGELAAYKKVCLALIWNSTGVDMSLHVLADQCSTGGAMPLWPAVLLAVATAVVKGSGEGKDKPVTFQGFHSLLKLLLSTLKVTFFFLQQVILGQGGGEDKWRRMEKDNGMAFGFSSWEWGGAGGQEPSAHSACLTALLLCLLHRSCIISWFYRLLYSTLLGSWKGFGWTMVNVCIVSFVSLLS